MAPWVKLVSAKPEPLSSTPRLHRWKERINSHKLFWPPHTHAIARASCMRTLSLWLTISKWLLIKNNPPEWMNEFNGCVGLGYSSVELHLPTKHLPKHRTVDYRLKLKDQQIALSSRRSHCGSRMSRDCHHLGCVILRCPHCAPFRVCLSLPFQSQEKGDVECQGQAVKGCRKGPDVTSVL